MRSLLYHSGGAGMTDKALLPGPGPGPFRYLSGLHVSPQGYQQFSGQGDDTNPPLTTGARRKAEAKPLAQITVRLIPQPAPGDLHHHRSQSSIARLADPLLVITIATLVRGRRQTRQRSQLPAVL